MHFYTTNGYATFNDFGNLNDFNLTPDTGIQVFNPTQLDNLDTSQQEKVIALFDKYKHVFSTGDHDLGCAKNVTHTIDTGDNKPVQLRAICRFMAAEQVVSEEVQALVEKGLLMPSQSPWASPVLVVKKKNGTNRVVINYHRLN